MPKKKAALAPDQQVPRIEIENDIVYRRGGKVHLQATVVEADPLFKGKERRRGEAFSIEQPDKWLTDDQLVQAVQKLFPHYPVVWRALDQHPV